MNEILCFALDNEKMTENELFLACLDEIIKIMPAEGLILAELSDLNTDEKEFFTSRWVNLRVKFVDFLIEILENKAKFLKVAGLTYDENLIETNFSGFLAEKVEILRLSYFKSEEQVIQELKKYETSETKQICVIEINYLFEDSMLYPMIWIIDQLRLKKPVVLLIRLSKSKPQPFPVINAQNWQILMFEDLFEKSFEILPGFSKLTDKELLSDNMILNFETNINSLLKNSIKALKFIKTQETENHINSIFSFITNNLKLIQIIRNKIFKDYNLNTPNKQQ